MNIREASADDSAVILQLIREIAEYENMLDEVEATEERIREWIFEKKAAEVLIGEVDGETAGFALFFYNFSTFVGKAGLYLEDIFIRPQYRGRGFGKKFLKRLAQTAVERGCGRMDWVCLDWNKPSIAFYKSLGAEPLDEWTIYRLNEEKIKQLAERAD